MPQRPSAYGRLPHGSAGRAEGRGTRVERSCSAVVPILVKEGVMRNAGMKTELAGRGSNGGGIATPSIALMHEVSAPHRLQRSSHSL